MKKIEVKDHNGSVLEYLDIEETRQRYGKVFKKPPSDFELITLLKMISSYRTFKFVNRN